MTIRNYLVTNYKTITLYIPIIFGIIAIIFCMVTTFSCDTIEFQPLTNNSNNSNTSNYQFTLTDSNTNTDFVFLFPDVAPILTYGLWRQRAYTILSTKKEEIDSGNNNTNSSTTTTIQLTISDSNYKCSKTPVKITQYDSYWRYSKIISILILILGSGIVVAHSILLCLKEIPTIRRWENITLALTFIIFGGFQASCIVFITDSIACNNYPPLQYQFPSSLSRGIQSYNLTLNDETTKSDLMNGWMEYIQTSYPQVCQASSGRIWLIVSSVVFFITGISMILTGPIFIQRVPPPVQQEEPNNTSSYWNNGLESSYLPTESMMDSNIIPPKEGENTTTGGENDDNTNKD